MAKWTRVNQANPSAPFGSISDPRMFMARWETLLTNDFSGYRNCSKCRKSVGFGARCSNCSYFVCSDCARGRCPSCGD